MKIDVATGFVTFASGAVGPPMDRATFLVSPIGATTETLSENAGFVQLHFRPEPGVHASALYKDDRIHQLFILMTIPSDETDEWNEARELERKVIHDKWLRQNLGQPPYEYDWGSVASEYDAKGCESEIIITYGT